MDAVARSMLPPAPTMPDNAATAGPPAAFARDVAQHAQGLAAPGRVRVVDPSPDVVGKGGSDAALVPAAGLPAKRGQLAHGVYRLGGLVAPAALMGGDVGPLGVVYVDVERAGAHDEPAVRVCGVRGVAMAAVEDDVAALVRLAPGTAHRGKPRIRQRGQREAVLLEQRELAFPFAVMGLVRVPHAHVQQALVVPAHVVEPRDRHEQRAAHRSDLVLHRPLLVPGVGVAKRVGEPVVGGEGREQIRCADDAAYLPADPGRVVEDDLAGHAAYVLEHGRKPLADAFGGLAVEHLREAHVGEREGADQVVHAGSHADDPEVGLAEVDLHLARGQSWSRYWEPDSLCSSL